MNDKVADHSTFSKNRDRLIESEVAMELFHQIQDQTREKGLLSDEHFTVDGTLIDAWTSQKSFQPKKRTPGGSSYSGRNPDANFRGESRNNATHELKTTP